MITWRMSDRATSEDNLLSLLGLIQISVAQIQQSGKKKTFQTTNRNQALNLELCVRVFLAPFSDPKDPCRLMILFLRWCVISIARCNFVTVHIWHKASIPAHLHRLLQVSLFCLRSVESCLPVVHRIGHFPLISYLDSNVRFFQQVKPIYNYTNKGKWNHYESQPRCSTLLLFNSISVDVIL